jgi:hypothetical protein
VLFRKSSLACRERMMDQMTVKEALHVLARVHTNYDEKTGFCIRTKPDPEIHAGGRVAYADAWLVVRMYLDLNVNPAPTPAET